MRCSIIFSFLIVCAFAEAQLDNIPIKFDNKTFYAFSCKGGSGEIFTMSDQMNKTLATVPPNKSQTAVLFAGKKGSVTWMDNGKGATFKLLVDKGSDNKRIYKVETSHHFVATVSIVRGVIGGLDLVIIELSGQYEYKAPPGILLPNYGNAKFAGHINVNSSYEGTPSKGAIENAFDFSITVPDYFYPYSNGKDSYNNQRGYFSGEKNVDAVVKLNTGFQINENDDSLFIIEIAAEGLPEGVPITISAITNNTSKWNPGSKMPVPARTTGKYFVVFTSEQEPASPHIAANGTMEDVSFNCLGIWWDDKLIPAEIINSKNFRDKLNTTPGKEELKYKEPIQTKPVEKTKSNKTVNQKPVIKQ